MAQVSKLSRGICGSLLFGSKLKKGSENSLCLSYERAVKNYSAPLRVSASVATAEKPSMSPRSCCNPSKRSPASLNCRARSHCRIGFSFLLPFLRGTAMRPLTATVTAAGGNSRSV
ncbi:unnamed protein product [Camellia sinensis]